MKMKLADLVLDWTLYPRSNLDSQHVASMVQALEAGAKLPPIVCCKKTKRIVDGFHRHKAYTRAEWDEVQVIEKSYATEGELFLDAIRYNAAHGQALTSHDKVHIAGIASKLSIDPEAICTALNMRVEAYDKLVVDRSATSANGVTVALKRTVRHMRGMKLSKRQVEANDRLGGMSASFFANQIILLIENDMINKEDEELAAKLRKLHGLLESVLTVR